MNPETQFIVKNKDFFTRLFGPKHAGAKSVNALWLRRRHISDSDIDRFVTMGVLEAEQEVTEVVEETVVSLQSNEPAKKKKRRGRPPRDEK